jgi:hypothetical protein
MRGSTAKVLRAAARMKHMEMVASGELTPPESPSHVLHQRRVLYQAAKKAFGSMPHDVKGRFATPFRRSRIERLNSGRS